jgi:hypothetical protein
MARVGRNIADFISGETCLQFPLLPVLRCLMTTEAVISQIPEKNQNAAMSAAGMSGGMY